MNSNYNSYPYGNPNNYGGANFQRNYYAFVNGLEGAKSYPIIPNQSLMLMDSENPVCYMKSADNTGKPSLKCYKLVEISEEELTKKPVDPETQALRDEISIMNKRIDELVKLMEKKNEVKADA